MIYLCLRMSMTHNKEFGLYFKNYLLIIMNLLTFFECLSSFFVVANAIVSGYLVLSLPLSIFHILRSRAHGTRVALLFLDAVSNFISIKFNSFPSYQHLKKTTNLV